MLDADKVKEMLSTEDIIRLCHDLQEDDTDRYDFQGHPVFSTSICHGGNSPDKLYYYPDSKLFHCFRAGTRVITYDGVKDIKTLVGHNVKILNGNGEWEEVSFHSYGKQPLMKVTLSSNGKEKIVYATPEHEWIVNGLNTKVITAQLPLNKYLAKITPKSQDIVPDPVGIIHGFTYGDGSLSSHTQKGGYSHRVIFYNESEKELKQYFKISGLKYVETSTLCDNGIIYESIQFHAAENMKKVPSINRSVEYLFGFLAGYYAADGSQNQNRLSICNYKAEDLALIYDIMIKCGLVVYPIRKYDVPVGQRGVIFNNKQTQSGWLNFSAHSVPASFFVTNKGRTSKAKYSKNRYRICNVEDTDIVEEVYCCQTSTHSFALEGFILTGNCWTCSDTKDIFEIVKFCKGFTEFYDAFKFVVDYFGIKDEDDREEVELTDDWDIFQKYKDLEVLTNNINEKFVNENILEYWPKASPEEWIKDFISEEAMDRYGIRIDSATRKIIIPHRDDNGNLIGIRGRAYDLEEMQRAKYAPVYLNNVLYNFPTGQYLYGLWQNKYGIQRTKKVLLCEGEKSVLQYASYYPPEDCICLATCGSNITQAQIDLLLKYGVEEVILGYDRDFDTYKGDPETKAYEEKLRKILQPLLTYFRVYMIMDYDHLLPFKGSPTDSGKEILEKLMQKRIYIPPIAEKIRR